MRIGIVGVHYGHIGGMVRSAANAPDGEFVGIVEADDELYARYTQDREIRRFESLEEMLDKASPELVMEGLRHDEKAQAVETCAEAGAHVLLDKPLCSNLEHWSRINAAVEAHGIKLSMFFTSRSHPPFIALREAILAGELGEIVSLISTHPHKLGANPPPLYFEPDAYAGTFHDVACHGLDQVRWLTGAECVGVHALGTLKKHIDPPGLKHDHVQASFELSNGALGLLTADWLTPPDSPSFGDTRFILMGTKGSAHLRAYAEDHLLIVADGKGAYEPDFPPERNTAFVQNMIEAISRGEENFISTSDVLAVARACIAAEMSLDRGGEFIAID